MKFALWLYLGSHFKQVGDEDDLPEDVPFSTPCTFSLRIQFILTYPCNVFYAVSKEKKPSPGLTSRLMNRCSCSTTLLRYFTCLSSTTALRQLNKWHVV